MATKYKKGKDGWYSTLIWDGSYNEDGSKHRKQIRSNKSSKDLETKVHSFKRKVEKKDVTLKTNLTFIGYAKEWKDIYKASKSINTKQMYNRIINSTFRELEGIRLIDIDRKHLQVLLNNNTAAVSRQAYLTFKQVIKSAITDRYLPQNKMDIFEGIEKPKAPAKERRVLTDLEKEKIKKGSFRDMDKAFLLIIYGCGLRRGEALALTRFDIDFKHKEIIVNKSLAFDCNNPVVKDTKSANGIRRIPMPTYLSKYLKSYLQSFNEASLFRTRGKDNMTRTSYTRMWNRIRLEIGSQDLTAHVFRHNFCTSLCYQIPTISIKKIAQLLGDHENMVMNVYNHIILEKEDAMGAINKALAL